MASFLRDALHCAVFGPRADGSSPSPIALRVRIVLFGSGSDKVLMIMHTQKCVIRYSEMYSFLRDALHCAVFVNISVSPQK